ncbi:MAG TPA: hypothetical protein VFG89_02240 [Coriobacteriia bacterium]|nr:hypothetical protein [Coriobacteriia bacterium]
MMLLVAVASFAIVVIGFGKVVAALITASVGALLAVLLAPWLWRRHARSKVLRLARENALGTPGYHRLRVDKEGLTDEGPDGAIGATWDRLQRVEQLSRHLLVFTGLVEAIVIPRTVGDARIADLMRLVEAHRPDLLSVRA